MVILITGITSGFGRAMAARLSADGHKVYGTHRKATDLLPGVTYIKADAQRAEDCEAAVKQVLDAEGRIDVFINNAGMGIGGPLEFSSLEDAERQMDVNWMGMVRFLHYVLPAMRRQGGGKILCFSSIGGLMGLPFQGLYSASKFAIEGYCEALRLETKAFGRSRRSARAWPIPRPTRSTRPMRSPSRASKRTRPRASSPNTSPARSARSCARSTRATTISSRRWSSVSP